MSVDLLPGENILIPLFELAYFMHRNEISLGRKIKQENFGAPYVVKREQKLGKVYSNLFFK